MVRIVVPSFSAWALMHTEPKTPQAPRTREVGDCPLCGTSKFTELFKVSDRVHDVPGVFNYDKCDFCGSVFQNPVVIDEDLRLIYPAEYSPYDYDPEMPDVRFDPDGASGLRGTLRMAVVRDVRNDPSDGRAADAMAAVLARSRAVRERAFFGLVIDECLPVSNGGGYAIDIGCGAGWMLKRLNRVGWNVEGIEWDEQAAEVARQRSGMPVSAGNFLTMDLEKGKYGLILLNHVFEHFSNTGLVLRRLRELLAEDGKIVLVYPNADSMDARWYGSDWFAWEPPRHLVLPSQKGLATIAKAAAFRLAGYRTRVSDHLWTKSKAIRLGMNPETASPRLNTREMAGLRMQKILNSIGLNLGSETIAVLTRA